MGESPRRRSVSNELSLETSIILGVLVYHRKNGLQDVSSDDLRFWFNIVNLTLGGSDQDSNEQASDAAFAAIHAEVLRAHFDDDNNDNPPASAA